MSLGGNDFVVGDETPHQESDWGKHGSWVVGRPDCLSIRRSVMESSEGGDLQISGRELYVTMMILACTVRNTEPRYYLYILDEDVLPRKLLCISAIEKKMRVCNLFS